MWRRRSAARTSFHDVGYEPVPSHRHFDDDDDDEILIDQFLQPSPKIPWSAVLFAAVLCFGGAALLGTAFLILIGYIDPKYVDRTWPMLTLGIILFLPGVYHLRIAILAYLNRPGYSFDDIPDFD